MNFTDLPIERKLLRMNLLSAGAALLLAGTAFVTYDLVTFRDTLTRRLTAFADLIGVNSASALLFNDVKTAEANLKALGYRPSITEAALYRPTGELFTAWSREPGHVIPRHATTLVQDRVQFTADGIELFHPIELDRSPVGTIYIRSDLRERNERLNRYLVISGVVLAISVLLAAFISIPLGRRISEPLLDLAQVARVVSQERNFSVRATTRAGGEIQLLVNAFNEMLTQIQQRGEALQRAHDELEQKVVERTTELRRKEEELYQSRRLESVGRLAGGVAHDFNNLLTGIIGCSETLESALPPTSELGTEVQEIKRAGERAAALTRQLLAFGRKQIISPQALNLNALLSSTGKLLRRLIGEDINLQFNLDPGLWDVLADPGQMDQVIVNLAVNARDAMPRGGKLMIQTKNIQLEPEANSVDLPAGDYVMMVIADSGVGMTKDIQAQIFEPFFTTKGLGKGTGLGLATVYGIVKQNHGGIYVQSQPGLGTSFKIFFPRYGESDVTNFSQGQGDAEAVPAPGGNEIILVVEDEALVSSHLARLLRRKGYEVLVAPGGAEAIELLKRRGQPVDLVLTDVVMPQMNGREMMDALLKQWPRLKALYMSGYPAEVIAQHGVLDVGISFIEKPFRSEQLCRRVRDVLDGAGA